MSYYLGGFDMKAISVKEPGGAKQLQMVEKEKPTAQANELLIKVKTAAVNRTDIINRQSKSGYLNYPILGVEVAGVVETAPKDSVFPKGTRVMGLINGGGYAEYAVMPVDRAMMIPEHLSYGEAAAIPEVFLTAYQTLFWIGKLEKGETVLIHAGGSGVGTAAIQLAKQLKEITVIITAGTQEKLDFGKTLGADHAINYKKQNFDEEVQRVTNNQGVDLILDFIGASYWPKNMNSIKVDGRWILIGVLGGSTVKNVDLMELLSKRIQLTGTLLTPRSNAYKAELTTEFMSKTAPLFNNKNLKPIVDHTFKLDDIQNAHERMEANKNLGKIVLKVE